MASVSIIARPGRGKQCTLYLLVVQQSHPAYASLKIKLDARHWHEIRRQVRKTYPHHETINRRLREVLFVAEQVALEMSYEEVKAIKDEILNRLRPKPGRSAGPTPETCFVRYFEQHIERLDRQDQVGTAKNHRTQLNKLRQFLRDRRGDDVLPWSAITPALIRDFENYLLTVVKNKRTTASKVLEIVRAVLRQAINVDRLLTRDQDPFAAVKLKRERADKLALTRDQIKRVEALDLETGSLIYRVRAWWLFAFFVGGMRFGDVAFLQHNHLRRDSEGWIVAWRQQKTGDHVAVPLHEQAQKILNDLDPGWQEQALAAEASRVFGILDGYDLSTEKARFKARGTRNALVNKYLKHIAEMAAVPAFSFHTARDSYVTFIMNNKGAGLYDAKDAVGHKKASTTEGYIRSLPVTRLRTRLGDPFEDW